MQSHQQKNKKNKKASAMSHYMGLGLAEGFLLGRTEVEGL
jgi:hypothetical protein